MKRDRIFGRHTKNRIDDGPTLKSCFVSVTFALFEWYFSCSIERATPTSVVNAGLRRCRRRGRNGNYRATERISRFRRNSLGPFHELVRARYRSRKKLHRLRAPLRDPTHNATQCNGDYCCTTIAGPLFSYTLYCHRTVLHIPFTINRRRTARVYVFTRSKAYVYNRQR